MSEWIVFPLQDAASDTPDRAYNAIDKHAMFGLAFIGVLGPSFHALV